MVGAFQSSIPFLADGGTLDVGEIGIVGEAGPELIMGPATAVPMGGGMSVHVHVPPARDPVTMARDADWQEALAEAFGELVANGFDLAPAP